MSVKVNWDGDNIAREMRAAGVQAVRAVAIDTQNEITSQLNRGSSNRGKTPSPPGQPPHRDTGALAGSFQLDASSLTPNEMRAIVGSNLRYACVVGADAKVPCLGGNKRISEIKVGDRVLTQTGEYQRVIATPRYDGKYKPNHVELVAKWRSGGTHRLTLTDDHNVLLHRDGRNVWVPAGEIMVGDTVYHRKKASHNKGVTTRPPLVCRNCGRIFSWRETGGRWDKRKYCSQACKSTHWQSGGSPHVGMTRSHKARECMARATRRRMDRMPESHPNVIMAQAGFMSKHERDVAEWLDARGLEYVHQLSVGRMFVDFYLPQSHEIIEADGAYWHQEQSVDVARDVAILGAMPGVRITHLHFYKSGCSPALNPEPLPNVRYVACNPGPSTFTEPDTCDPTEVIGVRRWTWKAKPHAKAPTLYDLSIEGVHSFFASGILISNSIHEYGGRANHATLPARPYVRPSVVEVEGRKVNTAMPFVREAIERLRR